MLRSPSGSWISRGIEAVSVAAGWGVLGLAILIAVEIASRKLFGVSIQGVDEIGGYVMATTTTFGFAYALLTKAHIRVDLLLNRLPPGWQAMLNVAALSTMTVFAAFLLYRGIGIAVESARIGATAPTPLGTPMILPQGMWALGLLCFAAVALALCFRTGTLLLRGRIQELNALLGTTPVEEEVRQEINEAERRSAG